MNLKLINQRVGVKNREGMIKIFNKFSPPFGDQDTLL
jgi:hypothetical protein